MYLPRHFQEQERPALYNLIRANPLGLLVAQV